MAAVTQVEVPVDSVEDWSSETVQKHEQGLCKFCKLRLKQNEAHKLNDQEVVEEDKRLKLLAEMARKCIWSGNCRRKKRKSSVWRGEDHEKVKLLEISAEDAERWERREKRKNPDLEFSDYAAAQLHQYHQLTKQTKPDVESYEQQREKDGGVLFSNIQQSPPRDAYAFLRGNRQNGFRSGEEN